MLQAEENLQIIVVCTPNYLHAEQTIAALNAGFHVLCEKPMALTVADCNAMINASKKNGKILHIVKQNRFNPPVLYLKKLLKNNSLGKIFSLSLQAYWNRPTEYYLNTWRGNEIMDGGILFTQFSHFLDILIFLFGEIGELEASGGNFHHQKITEFDDTIVSIIRFKNGILGSLHFSTCAYQSNREGSLSVLAEKGGIKIGGQYLNQIEYHNIEALEKPEFIEVNKPNHYGFYEGSMSNHEKVYENFVRALRTGEKLEGSLHESMLTVDIIQKMYASVLKYKK
jgi:predicted dehydrogenase